MRFLELLAELPVVVAPSEGLADMAALVTLGRELGLSAYDTAYLNLARRQGIPLATRDQTLRTAARRGGVALYQPNA